MSDQNTKKTDADKSIVYSLPVVPLRDLLVFPHMMTQLLVSREKSILALEAVAKKSSDVILVAQKEALTNEVSLKDVYSIGTLASLVQILRMPDGLIKVLVEGKKRVKVESIHSAESYLRAQFTEQENEISDETELKALCRSAKGVFESYAQLNKQISPATLMKVSSIEAPGILADVISGQTNLKLEYKQELLELFNVSRRLEKLIEFLSSEVDVLETEQKIRARIKSQIKKSQKEYYLNEQMQAIQKELGGAEGYHSEIQELIEKLKTKKMPKEAHKKVEKELKKLKSMSAVSAEASVIRSYVDWMLDLPWNEYAKENLDLKVAMDILNEDHWGLKKVKDRVIEHLAVQYLTKEQKGPILCLVGPPGVGKTSLAQSVARALNRPFARISLGGVRDEAEIRGHRRTYVGAMPGKVVQALKKCEYNNPLILLDEIDKMSMDFRGDPSAALLEVLDPEQNKSFSDHYLEVEYDLSKVMFLTTANTLHTMNRPLLDRLEVIHLDGYIEKEKFHIAKEYLVPKQLKRHGLSDHKIQVKNTAIKEIIHYYTREAGVRTLERVLATLFRKLATEIVSIEFGLNTSTKAKSDKDSQKKVVTSKKKTSPSKRKIYAITPKRVAELLGDRKFKSSGIEKQNEVGLTNGMAYTEVGGDLLPIEVTCVPGKGNYTLTGQLGDVMKESCSAALSYVRSRGPLFGLDKEFYSSIDVHIHVPEGAIPKDGPSAGIAITTSIVSSVLRIPVIRTTAMTGEVTLRGRVLPIGGLKEKVLAAYRGGIKTIFIPQDNKKDLKDIPEEVLKDLKIIEVSHVDQVLVQALSVKSPKEIFRVSKTSQFVGLKPRYHISSSGVH